MLDYGFNLSTKIHCDMSLFAVAVMWQICCLVTGGFHGIHQRCTEPGFLQLMHTADCGSAWWTDSVFQLSRMLTGLQYHLRRSLSDRWIHSFQWFHGKLVQALLWSLPVTCQGCIRGQQIRGQGQDHIAPRPKPDISEAKSNTMQHCLFHGLQRRLSKVLTSHQTHNRL